MVESPSMTEQGTKVESNIALPNRLLVKENINGIDLCHEIFPVGSSAFLSYFSDKEKARELQAYRMFNSVTGYPDTASVSEAPEVFKNSEERYNLIFSSEIQFYKKYLIGNKRESRYTRHVHDFSFDSWYWDNIHRLVDDLQEEGVPVSLELGDRDSIGIYHGVMLFERLDSQVLD
jgi:hypothetical protein